MPTVSVAPYLIRAYHQWMEDSGLTPHILVDCSKEGVIVPSPYIQQGKIVLNIASEATSALIISNETVSFKARFDGKTQTISVPTSAILTIYAGENGRSRSSRCREKQRAKTQFNFARLA